MRTLTDGNFSRTPVVAKSCKDAYAVVKKLEGAVKWQGDPEPDLLLFPDTMREKAPGCFVKANDCAGAFAVYKERNGRGSDAQVRASFDRKYASCAGK